MAGKQRELLATWAPYSVNARLGFSPSARTMERIPSSPRSHSSMLEAPTAIREMPVTAEQRTNRPQAAFCNTAFAHLRYWRVELTRSTSAKQPAASGPKAMSLRLRARNTYCYHSSSSTLVQHVHLAIGWSRSLTRAAARWSFHAGLRSGGERPRNPHSCYCKGCMPSRHPRTDEFLVKQHIHQAPFVRATEKKKLTEVPARSSLLAKPQPDAAPPRPRHYTREGCTHPTKATPVSEQPVHARPVVLS